MRDIGIFTSMPISSSDLVGEIHSFAGRENQSHEAHKSESVLGRPPRAIYVSHITDPTNGYFSDEEKRRIESFLGKPVEGYISIHFSGDEHVFALAESLANEISRVWQGIVDYAGAGGDIGVPP